MKTINKAIRFVGTRAIPLLLAGLVSAPFGVYAQESAPKTGLMSELAGMDPVLLVIIGMVLVLIIGIMFLLMYLAGMMNYIWLDKKRAEAQARGETFQPVSVWDKFKERFISGKLLKQEEERRVMLLDHEYDGIQEMDYGMPPWLRTFFIVTIAFAVFYLVSMYFFGGIKGSVEEYEMDMESARMEQEQRLARMADAIDENNVSVSTDKTLLVSGAAIFAKECKACHGASGEGGVGPNLTDEYWLHGGSIKDIFKTVKYGVPEKGMISWQKKLRPADMNAVSNYILTLGGTDPPNQKAPEGEKYVPESAPEEVAAAETTE